MGAEKVRSISKIPNKTRALAEQMRAMIQRGSSNGISKHSLFIVDQGH